MASEKHRKKRSRRKLLLKAISGAEIPENHYAPEVDIPPHVLNIVNGLKKQGAYSQKTTVRDIWRTLYKTQQELKDFDPEDNVY